MHKWMRTAGMAAMIGMLAGGCVAESDFDEPAAEHQSAEPGSAAPVPEETVTATLTEWGITLSPQSSDAGIVSFEIRNEGTEDHIFEIEGAGEENRTEPVPPGGTATLSVPLTAGVYNVYCPLDSGGESHADRGMKTTFRVD